MSSSLVFTLFFFFLLLQINRIEAKIFNAKHPECRNGTVVNIAFMGDSLNHRPYQYLKLPEKIINALKKINPNLDYQLNYFETAADGSKIINILTQQVPLVCQQAAVPGFKFDTILMFWDTDISNVIEWQVPTNIVSVIHKVFNANLSTTIVDLLNCTEIVRERFGIAGPGLLGEDQFIIPALFYHKYDMLNTYQTFFKNQTISYGGTYIDMRAQYQKEIPSFRGYYPGHAWNRAFMKVKYSKTQGPEGEHPNGNGSDTDAQEWANYLYGMFFKACSNFTKTNSDDDYYNFQ